MTVKFHEKNQAVYFGLQSASGSANKVASGSLGSTTAIACTSVTADPTRETGSFQFLGDSLSRDEYTYEKDTYINLQLETFQQILSDLGTAITPNTASIWKILQTCGANIGVDATTKYVTAGNNVESPDYGTADVRLASPDDATNDKLYKFWDLRGSVDVEASVGEVPKLKFSLYGNADDPAAVAKQVADFGTQTTRVAPSVLYTTIKNAQMVPIDDVFTNSLGTVSSLTYTADGRAIITTGAHSLTVGTIRMVQVAGATPAALNGNFVGIVTSATTVQYFAKGVSGSGTATGTITAKKGDTAPSVFCFSTLSAPNFFGFDYQRYQTGCDIGFTKGAIATDISVTMLEDQVGGTSFNPDVNVTKFFALHLEFGSVAGTAGTKVAYLWDKAQIANVKQGKIATYLARDVSFRNTGSSFMLWT